MRTRTLANIWAGALWAGLLFAGLAGCQTGDQNLPQSSPIPPAVKFSDGGWIPNHTIAYGTYTTTVPGTGTNTCYYEVLRDDDLKTRRANGFGDGGQKLTLHVLPGDGYVNSSGCGTWTMIGASS